MEKIKVVVTGPRGKMGRSVFNLIREVDSFELVGVIDNRHGSMEVEVFTDAYQCFETVRPDVLVDFTNISASFEFVEAALKCGVRPVIGTSGFNTDNICPLVELSREVGIGGIIAPNFTVGGVLMMKFATMAAKYFNDIEIVEMHHDQKLDAPSGTAIRTAEMISSERMAKRQGSDIEQELIVGARGADYEGMKIHSVRLPGLVAHQQILLGSTGELITIRHDSFNRESFMTGIRLAIESVLKLEEMVYGLENLLD